MIEINKIYHEDCIETMSKMPDEFLDLTVTSPPYNVNLGENKYNDFPYDLYNDNKDHGDYIEWLKERFELLYNKTKVGGRCVINIGDGKNGRVPTHSDIIKFMTDIGWIPFFNIIWNKRNAGNRTSWGSFQSPSCPSFPTPYEYIMGFAKDNIKLQSKGETDLTKQEFIDWSLSIWEFNSETQSKKKGHPAAFPVELPLRCIKLLTWVGAVVYDPFMGSGTTAKMAYLLKRNWIGSEISEKYTKLSEKRLEPYLQQSDLFQI